MSATNLQPLSLTQLLTEQKQLLAQFLELTSAQTQLIESEDIEALNKNLETRAQIIGKADILRPNLDRLYAEQAARPGQTHAPEVTELREQISRILQKITEIDTKNQLAVRERMEFFQAEIRRVGQTRKGAATYLKGADIFTAEFVDERQ